MQPFAIHIVRIIEVARLARLAKRTSWNWYLSRWTTPKSRFGLLAHVLAHFVHAMFCFFGQTLVFFWTGGTLSWVSPKLCGENSVSCYIFLENQPNKCVFLTHWWLPYFCCWNPNFGWPPEVNPNFPPLVSSIPMFVYFCWLICGNSTYSYWTWHFYFLKTITCDFP